MFSRFFKTSPTPENNDRNDRNEDKDRRNDHITAITAPPRPGDSMDPKNPPKIGGGGGSATTAPSTPAPLASAWAVRAAAGEPSAVVSVRDLAPAAPPAALGRDAWGRARRAQPVLLSAELSFRGAFAAAARDDRLVPAETAHYGSLSKALLGTLEGLSSHPSASSSGEVKASGGGSGGGEGPSTADVFDLLWARLTGRSVDGSQVALPPDQVAFVNPSTLRALSLTLRLPKASLVGLGGVSLTVTAGFRDVAGPPSDDDDDEKDEDEDKKNRNGNPQSSYARTLRLHRLHVPTLIGVNDNERAAKQLVVADVEIERFDERADVHAEIERAVVDAMEKSSFETLEALGAHVAERILADFRVAATSGDASTSGSKTMRERGWQVRVRLEKPIAVPLAECPCVEVCVS